MAVSPLTHPHAAAGPALAELRPMEPGRRSQPFIDAAWAFQLSPRGGQRVLVELGGERGVCLHSPRHVDITAWFPEVAEALPVPSAGRVVLDAELCVLDAAGRNDVQRLRARCLVRGARPGADAASLIVRDVLVHDGQDVRGWTWSARRRLLRATGLDGARARCAGAVDGDGCWMHRQAEALGGVDVLAMCRHAPYEPGLSASCVWIPAREAAAVRGGRGA